MAASSYYPSMIWFVLMSPIVTLYCVSTPLLVTVNLVPLPPTPPRRGWAIVTGSNTGIGYETARALAEDYEYPVIMACRNETKGRAAAATFDSARAQFRHLDLTSLPSVRSFVQGLEDDNIQVEILVNNAGRITSPTEPTVDGMDNLFQTNFAGHFVLTEEIIQRGLLVSPSSPTKTDADNNQTTIHQRRPRIVNLASVMHHFIDGDSREMAKVSFWKERAVRATTWVPLYCYTKLAAVLYSVELNRRYPDKLEAVAVNPGGVYSDIWRRMPSIVKLVFQYTCLTNQQGAHTSIAAAVGSSQALGWNEDEDDCYYLQPYWIPSFLRGSKSPVWPPLEMLGPFQGHVKIAPRLHSNFREQAAALWQAMAEMTGIAQSCSDRMADGTCAANLES